MTMTHGKQLRQLDPTVVNVRRPDLAEICRTSEAAWSRALGFLSSQRQRNLSNLSTSSLSSMYTALIESRADPVQTTKVVQSCLDSEAAYNSLIMSFAKSYHVAAAKQILVEASEASSWEPSAAACNLILAADDELAAPLTFDTMLSCKLRPNVASYSTLISAWEKQQDTDAALGVLNKMTSREILPNVVAYSAAISACGGKWQISLSLFARMRLQIVEQDTISYNSAITSCEKGKKAGSRVCNILNIQAF